MNITNSFKQHFKENKSLIIVVFTCTLGACGIISAMLGYYLKVGWNPLIFFTWDVPLYLFCIWSIYKGVYKPLKNYNIK